jgi:UDP-N-acetylmuramoyl-L-alanyl-D-glutamate--2,6-diaminopimelate ligase
MAMTSNRSTLFDDLLAGVATTARAGKNPRITNVVFDSRQVSAGALFVAMRGETSDGNRFLASALERGAVAILTDSETAWRELAATPAGLGLARVAHGRQALAGVSANFFGHPERALGLHGVTGTNGKTTTTYILDAMLRAAGRETVLIGTIEYRVAGTVFPSPHTTPESRDVFALFAEGVTRGATEAVMEVSSHALDQGRVWGMRWDTATFTNLTQDHLDYHGDMERYFQAKALLFRGQGAAAPRVAVLHTGDEYGERLVEIARAAGSEVVTYGLQGTDYSADQLFFDRRGTRFQMHTPQGAIAVHTRLAGPVNVLNLLGASAAAMARGLSLDQVEKGIAAIDHVPGRFQTIDCGQPFTVAVDYAHTDDALRNVTALARSIARQHGGRVLTVFGCGGDRDRAKRPKMGRAAAEGSDFVVVTSDNPRSEDPEAILREILPGVESVGTRYAVVADRAAAISTAIGEARANDVVVIAGKGHEKVQIIAGRSLPFDDADVARRAIEARMR